jgi:hypothetical protein
MEVSPVFLSMRWRSITKAWPTPGKFEVVVEASGGPDRALLDATMRQGGWLAEVGPAATLEDQADIFAQGRLVVFNGEDVVGVVVDEAVGELALGQ